MNHEILQSLIGVYNILFNMPAIGDAIVPMAQCLTTLQNVIQALGSELDTNDGPEHGVEG